LQWDLLDTVICLKHRLGVKPRRSWNEAVVKYLQETGHKATHQEDIRKLRWLDRFLRDVPLDSITRAKLEEISEAKARDASKASANRYLALVRSLLRKAANEWEWIDRAPKVRMFKEQSRRVRWITRAEADALLRELPEHLAEMVRFSLSTGLRQRNVTELEWSQIDMPSKRAWIHPDQAKARKAIAVPLNEQAVAVLLRQVGKHLTRVFTYQVKRKADGSNARRAAAKRKPPEPRPVKWVNNTAWKNALRRAGIAGFRWHDLRHTWASWHVQAGTSLYELQQLGGWGSADMVKRYAHMGPEHLAKAAANIVPIATKLAAVEKEKGAA
jgi:integrase